MLTLPIVHLSYRLVLSIQRVEPRHFDVTFIVYETPEILIFLRRVIHPYVIVSNPSLLKFSQLLHPRVFLLLPIYHPMSQIHNDKRWFPLLLNLLLNNSLILWFQNFLLVFQILVIKRIIIKNPLILPFKLISLYFLDLILSLFPFISVVLFPVPDHML